VDILTDHTVKQTYMLPDFDNREAAHPLFRRLMDFSNDPSKYVRAIANETGVVGFLNHTEIMDDAIELGYVIHPDFQCRGYMTQALTLAAEELYSLGYRKIITGAFSTNKASIRVMEKCGMQPMEKTEEIAYRGEIHQCVYYYMEKQE
jgi:RimJ/RimL family protein N-acetyltransferase